MSIPVSLRLCCIAAMAPALTESTSQPRVQLPGSPPPVVSNSFLTEHNTIDQETRKHKDIASVKAKVPRSLSSELQNTARSLLKSVEGNIDVPQAIFSEKVQNSLRNLGLNPSFSDILKHLTPAKSEATNCTDSDLYNKVSKTMNQPSPVVQNGCNEPSKNCLKQTLNVNDTALNGHSKKHSDLTKRLSYGHTSALNSQDSRTPSCGESDSKMCINSGTNTSQTQSSEAVPSTSQQATRQRTLQMGLQQNLKLVEGTPDLVGQDEVKPVDMKEVTRKEYLLERRGQFLLRRLRRLQGKHVDSHVKQQLKAFVDFQHQNLQSAASKAIRPFGDLPNALFNSHDVKNLSTSNLVTLVRKLQASQPKQTLDTLNTRRIDTKKSVLVMEQSVSSESERKSGHLRRDFRHWSDVADSDATEGSSGGESCEEWEDCPVMSDNKVPTPLYKRAEWKWAVERAAIVARWTWLQAQVSDLEYRIRQQSEIYKTIRTSKGVVTLCEPPLSLGPGGDASNNRLQEMSPANFASLMINVNKQASRLSHSLGNCLSPSPAAISEVSNKDGKPLNGIVDRSHVSGLQLSTPVNTTTDCTSANVSPFLGQPLDVSCVAARCRPVRFYRKRKLLHTAGLHQVSHKAARLSSVKCTCYPPVMPCPMCGGRYNNTQKLDAECMPIMEKVSLLDSSFHPVLSFPQEIALPLHFEALLKSGEWQTQKSQPKVTHRALAAEKRRQKLLNAQIKEQARKNKKKYNKSASAVLLTSAKLRNKYDAKSPHKKQKKVMAESRLQRSELKRRRSAQMPGDGDVDSQAPSPQMKDGTLSHSASSSTLKDMKEARRRRFENAYDINNIVIPYSMAAATRVEKLKYKEIQTPKWREVEQSEQETDVSLDQTEVEDLTDEMFSIRHEELEMEERKRIRNYITYPPVRRSRLSRESESNTVDTFSPEASLTESNFLSDGAGSLYGEERKRCGSTSRRGGFFDDNLRDYDYDVIKCLEPWPDRQFPLTEETYEVMKLEQSKMGPTRNTYRRPRTVKVQDDPSMEFISPDFEQEDSTMLVASPCGSEASSLMCEDEDDPEWNESRGDRRSSVSTKHSKR